MYSTVHRRFIKQGLIHLRAFSTKLNLFAVLLLVAVIVSPVANAQTLGDIMEQIGGTRDQALQDMGRQTHPETPENVEDDKSDLQEKRDQEEIANDRARAELLKPSALEKDYADRIGDELRQFGYETFIGDATSTIGSGEIDDSYILGIGDELFVTFRGQLSNSFRVEVDRNGQVILPQMSPIPAAGRTLGDFKNDLAHRTDELFISTQSFVSVASVRRISVAVLGEVQDPGVKSLNSFASVLDGLFAARGIKKTGSLRNVRLKRGGRTITIDLYDLLLDEGGGRDLSLRDGDRIVVPVIGPTIAVAGEVKRPGIYELAPGAGGTSVDRALGFAGGTLRPWGNRLVHVAFDAKGLERVKEIAPGAKARIGASEILKVYLRRDALLGSVNLEGHVNAPGPRSLDTHPRLSDLLEDATVFDVDPYLMFAVLQTRDNVTLTRRYVPIDLQDVLSGVTDVSLTGGDSLIVFSRDDVRFLFSAPVQLVLRGDTRSLDQLLGPDVSCEGLVLLRDLIKREQADRFRNALQFSFEVSEADAPLAESVQVRAREIDQRRAAVCPEVFDKYPELLPLALEHVIGVTGDVRVPGVYPLATRKDLRSLLTMVGGLGRTADTSAIEVTRYDYKGSKTAVSRTVVDTAAKGLSSVMVAPGDVIRVNSIPTVRDRGLVTLVGEVVRPGRYDIRRGERLSELFERAGGLTDQAYPLGTVFTRDRVKELQRQAFNRTADEMQSGIVSIMTRQSQRGAASGLGEAVGAVRELVNDLRNAPPTGRVVVEADPAILSVRPELDTVLEPGDVIAVPKRPNYVMVVGEVLNAGALQFRTGADVTEYIDKAGGLTSEADESNAFVIYPDGSARTAAYRVLERHQDAYSARQHDRHSARSPPL